MLDKRKIKTSPRHNIPIEKVKYWHGLYLCGMSFRKLSANYVPELHPSQLHLLFQERKLPIRKRKKTPKFKYNGDNYTLNKDDYWRKTSGDRELLHRQVWKDKRGPIPPNHDVRILCDNRKTTNARNLEVIDHEEHKKLFISNNQFTKGRTEIVIQEIVCLNCEELIPYRGPSPSAHNRRIYCDSRCKHEHDEKLGQTILHRRREFLKRTKSSKARQESTNEYRRSLSSKSTSFRGM